MKKIKGKNPLDGLYRLIVDIIEGIISSLIKNWIKGMYFNAFLFHIQNFIGVEIFIFLIQKINLIKSLNPYFSPVFNITNNIFKDIIIAQYITNVIVGVIISFILSTILIYLKEKLRKFFKRNKFII